MIYLILGILFFTAVLIWDVQTDKSKTAVKHTKEAWIRAILLTPSAICLVLFNPSLLILPIVIVLQGSWYFLLFDGLLNKAKGQNWWFTGSIDPDDAESDQFLRKLTLTQHKLLKFGLAVISTLLYILL